MELNPTAIPRRYARAICASFVCAALAYTRAARHNSCCHYMECTFLELVLSRSAPVGGMAQSSWTAQVSRLADALLDDNAAEPEQKKQITCGAAEQVQTLQPQLQPRLPGPIMDAQLQTLAKVMMQVLTRQHLSRVHEGQRRHTPKTDDTDGAAWPGSTKTGRERRTRGPSEVTSDADDTDIYDQTTPAPDATHDAGKPEDTHAQKHIPKATADVDYLNDKSNGQREPSRMRPMRTNERQKELDEKVSMAVGGDFLLRVVILKASTRHELLVAAETELMMFLRNANVEALRDHFSNI